MPASIGGKEFLTWQGPKLVTGSMQVSEITRDGFSGHAFNELGVRAFPVSVTTSVDTDDAETLGNQYLDLQGTFVTVVNVDGESVSNVMVVAVRIVRTKKVLSPVGGLTAGDWIITAQWELQATA